MIFVGYVIEFILVKVNKKVKMFLMRGQFIVLIDFEQGFEMKEIIFEKNDKLIFYLDGFIESKNKQGEMYGKKRFIKRILSIKNINIEFLIRDVRNFVFDIDDDIVVLMIEKM